MLTRDLVGEEQREHMGGGSDIMSDYEKAPSLGCFLTGSQTCCNGASASCVKLFLYLNEKIRNPLTYLIKKIMNFF